jgi:hypothetical protein
MAEAKVVSTYQGSPDGNNFTSTAIDTTGATAILVIVSNFSGDAAATLTDSVGNSYGAATNVVGGNARLQYWLKAGPTTSATHTFTLGGASFGSSIAVIALSGTATASAFGTPTTASGSAVSTLQPGSITPDQDGEALITAYAASDTVTSVSAPFSPVDGSQAATGNHLAIALAFELQTTATARNPTWTASGATDMAVFMVNVKPAAAAADTLWAASCM